MPQLVKLQEEHKDTGFVIIANHSQNVEKDTVVSYLRSVKANFMVTSGSRLAIPNQSNGIPRAYLFNSKGELVDQGHPMTMKPNIVKLIESEPSFIAAGRDYTSRKVASYANALKRAPVSRYSAIVRGLTKEAEKDGDDAADAKYLLDRLVTFGQKRLDRAKELETENAFKSMQTYQILASGFKGHEIGTKAGDRVKELKKDKDFQTELKAATIAAKILADCKDLKQTAGSATFNLDYGPNKRIAARVRAGFQILKKRYADANATSKLEEELKSYGFRF